MFQISLFEEKQVRRAWNEKENRWYFSVDDVVLALTDSSNVKDYIKKLRKRDPELDSYWGTNCPPVENLIFTMLDEASTTEIAKKRDARGFTENKKASQDGGSVAGKARKDLERQSGKRISTRENFKALPEATKRIARK